MKRIYQRIIDPVHGDCWRCVIASILELEYEDMPVVDTADEKYREKITLFLAERDVYMNWHLWNGNLFENTSSMVSFKELQNHPGIDGLFLGTVASPKYYNPTQSAYVNVMMGRAHAVVINHNFEIVFDPNPMYQDLKKYPYADEIGYNGLVCVELIRRKSKTPR